MSGPDPGRNFTWVIERALCGLALPGRRGPIDRDLERLRGEGVTLLVTAMAAPLPAGALAGAGLVGLHVPIRDFAAATAEQLDGFVARTRAEIDGGGAVAVHCFAGMGRTGTLLAAYLVAERGLAGDAAIKHIRELRPGSIETFEQEEAVRSFARRRLGRSPDR
jgi:atypical dual specificity phosphatase